MFALYLSLLALPSTVVLAQSDAQSVASSISSEVASAASSASSIASSFSSVLSSASASASASGSSASAAPSGASKNPFEAQNVTELYAQANIANNTHGVSGLVQFFGYLNGSATRVQANFEGLNNSTETYYYVCSVFLSISFY